LYNKYKPGQGGVGASSTANRRAKNRLATICNGTNKCFPCYNTLGQYSNYTHNPNGFVPCPGTINIISSSGSVTPTPTPTPPSTTYTLRYRNTASGGTEPAPITSYSGGTSVAILGNTFTNTNPTYLFGGWNTSSNGTGTYYPFPSTLTMPYANTTLWAQWYNPSGTDYQVIYNGNGSSSGTVPATANYKNFQGVGPIPGNTGNLSNPGLTFYGWNTAANGSGTAYPAASNGFTMPAANVTLYAQWVNTSTNYILTYDGNGSTGGSLPASPSSYPSGAGVSVLGQTSLTRSGYTFLGWNTAADGTGSIYQQGSSVVMNSNVTLYAQWAPGTILKDCGSFTGELTIPSIYTSGSRTVYRDTTNNTITITIPTFYSNSAGGPYGTGNGPTDTGVPTHSGNLKSSYATATISQIAGVYQINTTYTTAYTGGTYTQTSTLPFTSTYWPTSETISTVSYYTNNLIAGFIFDPTSSGTPSQPGTNTSGSGCFGGASYSPPVTTLNSIVAFYINFSNGTTTRVALGTQFRLSGTTNPYTYVFNYTRAELANGPTPSPITGTFTPTASTFINTPNV
jgi:uncharacterized repeat protein (TIGR02543 family)